jgi:hypothetical protein
MSESDIFLDYYGPVDFAVIDSLLVKLKKTKEYKALHKTTAKRLYSLVVECLENICRHSELSLIPEMYSHLSIRNETNKFFIQAGNPVSEAAKYNISNRLDYLNASDEVTLRKLYENKINSDLESGEKCAGLGFISMALKSGNKLNYSFNILQNDYSYFELLITLNKYIMRKLTIDQKSNSPSVILDPEKRIFMISGESRPPDVRDFYEPVILWLEDFSSYLIKSPDKKEPVMFNFNFEYFNSSSGKLILDICKILVSMSLKGLNININWHFEKDDYDMLEAGKEMSRIVKFPFEFVEDK